MHEVSLRDRKIAWDNYREDIDLMVDAPTPGFFIRPDPPPFPEPTKEDLEREGDAQPPIAVAPSPEGTALTLGTCADFPKTLHPKGTCENCDMWSPEGQRATTLTGKSRDEWVRHIDNLFAIAIPGEDIPEEALLYGWSGALTDEDRAWAKAQIAELPSPLPNTPQEERGCACEGEFPEHCGPECDCYHHDVDIWEKIRPAADASAELWKSFAYTLEAAIPAPNTIGTKEKRIQALLQVVREYRENHRGENMCKVYRNGDDMTCNICIKADELLAAPKVVDSTTDWEGDKESYGDFIASQNKVVDSKEEQDFEQWYAANEMSGWTEAEYRVAEMAWKSGQAEVSESAMKKFLPVCEGDCDHPYCWSQKAKVEEQDGEREPLHELKIWPAFFRAVMEGRKTYEIRKNDRGFMVGDPIRLNEYDPTHGYTGKFCDVKVTYLTEGGQWGLPEDICVMSIIRRETKAKSVDSLSPEEPTADLTYFLRLAEHKLDQRLQGQYTEKQILGMLLKLARELLLKHKISALDVLAQGSPSEEGTAGDTICGKCGVNNIVWFTENEIWNVLGKSGVLCVSCFVGEIEATGFDHGAWKIVPENWLAQGEGTEWIECQQDQPRENGRYLVQCSYTGKDVQIFDWHRYDRRGRDGRWHCSWISGEDITPQVIRWQPLPAPPVAPPITQKEEK